MWIEIILRFICKNVSKQSTNLFPLLSFWPTFSSIPLEKDTSKLG